MFIKIKLFVLCCLFSFYQPIFAASFDCAKAYSQIEKMICADPQLSQLDSELLPIYQKARKATNDSKAFRDNGKKALRWRSKNCKDKACLIQWYQDRKTELVQIAEQNKINNKQPCVTDGKPITLTGKIIEKTYPGPPNFESITEGDKALTAWFLVIDKPICALADTELTGEHLENIEPQKTFQLVLKNHEPHNDLLNKTASVTATPYTRHTAYHQTPLLLEVKTLTKAP